MNYKEKFINIKAIVLDVDGVLTDGKVLLSPDGSMSRSMNVKDGYAMQYTLKQNLILAVITGGNDPQVKNRLQYLGLTDIYMKSLDKMEDYRDLKFKYDLDDSEILYIGDDLPDIAVLQQCGLSVCPKDAAPEVKNVVDYISYKKGGKGCVREVLEQCLKIQGKWHPDLSLGSI